MYHKHSLVLLQVAFFCSFLQAADKPFVKMPLEVKGQKARLLTIPIESNGKHVRWVCVSDDCDLFREYDPDPAKIKLRFIAYKEGKFKLLAYTAVGDEASEPAICLVVIGEPGPDPLPPSSDPLAKALQAAYATDQDVGKATLRASLAALYRQAATAAETDKTLTTWGDLFAVMVEAANTLGLKGRLSAVQAVIQKELLAVLPVDPKVALDSALAAKTFRKIAAALEAIQ